MCLLALFSRYNFSLFAFAHFTWLKLEYGMFAWLDHPNVFQDLHALCSLSWCHIYIFDFKKKIRAILVCVLFFRCHSHFLLESLCIRKRKKNDWWLLTKLVTDCKNSQCLIFHLWVILFAAGRPKRGVFSGVFATRHEGRGHSNEGIPQWLDSIGKMKLTGEKILITCTLCETTTMM